MSTRTQKITVSSSVLKWARVTLFGGKKWEAASKLKISESELQQWEERDPTISIAQLKKISKEYKRHVSVLLLKTPPVSKQPPKLRKIFNFEHAAFDKNTFLAIREAQEIQEKMKFLLNEKNNQFIDTLQKSDKKSSADLVEKVISVLKITSETRLKSKTSREQLTIWKRLLEMHGVVVLELNFPISDARAFTLFDKIAPIIVLNSKDSDNARIFSLFHEFGHIILGQTNIDEELNLNIDKKHKVEFFCNQFSGQILVPQKNLNEETIKYGQLNEDEVQQIANHFKVSTSVIWRRLKDEKYISRALFRSIQSKLSRFEPFSSSNTKKKFMANKNTHLYTKIKRKSEVYINEVFEAYNQNRLSYSDVIRFIGIKSDYITPLQKLMYR